MKTPCRAACKNVGGICQGCHRTTEEIANWQYVTDDDREQVMQALARENATHTCTSCGEPARCDISAGHTSCWCFEIEEREVPLQSNSTCYCRKCLAELPVK